jgi:hypothetical protein
MVSKKSCVILMEQKTMTSDAETGDHRTPQVITGKDLWKMPPPRERKAGPVCLGDEQVTVSGQALSEVWWAGRQWAVTEYGIERRDGGYAIERWRLDELEEGWIDHIGFKPWADPDDFATAFVLAKALHGPGGKAFRKMLEHIPARKTHE